MTPRTQRAKEGSGTLRERRRSTRARTTEDVRCDRGQVIDLSGTGMRLVARRRWSEGQVRRVMIERGTDRLVLEARCVWCRQDGMFTHSVGLSFDGASEAQREVLRAIARALTEG